MTRPRKVSVQTRQVLKALLETPDIWWHGYQLCKHTRLKSGTLYPILIRLSDQGYLTSQWREADPPGRPPRHQYRLSATGQRLAASFAAADQSEHGSLNPVRAPS